MTFLPRRLLLSLVALLAATPLSALEILPVDEVKPGMIGEGRSVFVGDEIETFEVEILSVVRNADPGRHMILGEARGGPLAETGIQEGMSGSPVYVDGKLIGACAFTWSFWKRAMVGITPIEYMLDVMARGGEAPGGGDRARRLDLGPGVDMTAFHAVREGREPVFLEPIRERLQPPVLPDGLAPITVPLTFSGFDPEVVARVRPMLSPLGLAPVAGGGAADDDSADAPPLRPGSAMAARMVRGDLDMSAIGTVTWTGREHVLGFGHPFFGTGSVDFPLGSARVHAVIPRSSISFKMASPVRDVGAIRQDRMPGVYGVLGARSRMIPVVVEVERPDGVTETRRVEIIHEAVMSPLLAMMSIESILTAAEKDAGPQTLELLPGSRIDIEGHSPVKLANLYSGEFAARQAASSVSTALAYLLNNEHEEPSIREIRLSIRAREERREAVIEKVQFGRTVVEPGETLQIEVFLRPRRGDSYVEMLEVRLPEALRRGRIAVHVGDAAAITRILPAARGRLYSDLEGLIALLNAYRPNAGFYVSLSRVDESLYVDGRPLPNLPASYRALLGSKRVQGDVARYRLDEFLELEIPEKYVVDGLQRIVLEVKDER